MQALNTISATATAQPRASGGIESRSPFFPELQASAQSVQACAAHTTVFYEGDPAASLYEVVQGVVKMYKLTPDGRRQIIGFAFPGEIMGSVLGEDYTCTAEVVAAAKLRRLSRQQLLRDLQTQPGLSRRLLDVMTSALALAQEQMLLLGRKSAPEKIASFLLDQSEKCEERGENPNLLFLPMTRCDIADYLGLTTETVSRTISCLKKRGVIDLDQATRIRIRDIDALTDLAEGDEQPF